MGGIEMRGSGAGRGSRALIALILLFCFQPAAAMAEAPAFSFNFPEAERPGPGAGELTSPVGVATDASGENVYVAEAAGGRVSVFSPWGEFRMAFGWGVADGTSEELQVCVETCFRGLRGDGPGQFDFAAGVAVDASGNIYVVDEGNERVQKFSPAGEFLLMFGGEVNKTTGGNVCTAASLDVCGAGVQGAGPGEFQGWGSVGTNIAVASDGTVYVGDQGRIQAFAPDGSFKKQFAVALDRDVHALTVDPLSGDLYFAYLQMRPTLVDDHVYRVTPLGVPVCSIEVSSPEAVAVDNEGSLWVVKDPEGGGVEELEPSIQKFDSACDPLDNFGNLWPLSGYALRGLATNRIGNLYVSTNLLGGPPEGEKSYVGVYGPLPFDIEPAPPKPPTIASQFAASVTDTTAVLKAQINPHFFGSTTYYIEYGTEDCSQPGASCQLAPAPAPPGTPLGGGERNSNITSAGIPLSGLQPDTTYFFRFVAISGTFTTKGLGETEAGPSSTFHTRRPPANLLPDNRAYEKVSPAEKNNGEVAVPQPSTGGAVENGMAKPLQASPEGDAITFPSFAAFAEAEGAPAASQYLSHRGSSGWTTRNITPPARGVPVRDPLRGFSEDLATGAVVQHDPPLVPGATPGVENLYLQDSDSGALQLLTPEAPRLNGVSQTGYCIGVFGASDDMSHVIFMANGALTPEAPESPSQSLYEWVAGQGIRLVSVLPNGTPATPSLETGFGEGAGEGANCSVTESLTYRAISADGQRIFWTDGARLYARTGGTETIALDATKGGSGPAGGGRYRGASGDGSKVFFTAPGKLVPGAKGGDLYRYDFNAEELKAVSLGPVAPEVVGVLGVSEDGDRAYFAAKGALAAGATAGKPNLYLWDSEEGLRFLATLTGAGDASNWGGSQANPTGSLPERQTSRLTPDGSHLAFLSAAPLTGYDNTDQQSGKPAPQVYLYDAEAERLSCASCNPTGSRPIGPSTLITWAVPFQQPRYLSDEGTRLFFESQDAIAQADTNAKKDVYEFERAGTGTCTTASSSYNPAAEGCIDLISSGTSGQDTYLLDASADGRDVFISTRQRLLLGADLDDRYDVYDARSGGGFPEPPLPPLPCTGEACRPPSAPPPASGPPPSSTLQDQGNVKQKKKHHKKKCTKKQKKKGKCKHKGRKAKAGKNGGRGR
jgi:DNA-binding beta-propeller fold protein YncE